MIQCSCISLISCMNAHSSSILIVGDTGFIGAHLKRHISTFSPETAVFGFSRSAGHDVRNFEQISDAVRGKDFVINVAGTPEIHHGWHNIKHIMDVDAIGSINIMKACVRSNVPLIHISSADVYGTNLKPGTPMAEDHPLRPKSPRGVAKRAVETVAMNLIHNDVPVRVLRLFTPYGTEHPSDMRHRRYNYFVARVIRACARGEDIIVEEDGDRAMDWVCIDDVVEAIWQARFAQPGVYNIASGRSHSFNQIAQLAVEQAKKIFAGH